jgi:hypothetical protein
MAGAILTHLLVLPGSPIPAIVLTRPTDRLLEHIAIRS